MTSGAQLPEQKPVKMALCGDSGVGKSGAVVSLILDGYNVRTIDVDNGVDIILNCLHDPNSPYHALARDLDLDTAFRYETVNHKMITLDDGKRVRIQPSGANVWPRLEKLVHEWKEDCGVSLGPISSWSDDTVLVLDSSTFAAYAAFAYSLQLNNRLGADPAGYEWQRDVGAAQEKLEEVLRLLFSSAVKCNVIVITHINYISESIQETRAGPKRTVSSGATDVFGVARAYPSAIGRALGPRFGRYFNNVVEMRLDGIGRHARRNIHTVSQGNINVKTAAPFSLKPSYDVSTGLAEIFAVLRNKPPPSKLLNHLAKPAQPPVVSINKSLPIPRSATIAPLNPAVESAQQPTSS